MLLFIWLLPMLLIGGIAYILNGLGYLDGDEEITVKGLVLFSLGIIWYVAPVLNYVLLIMTIVGLYDEINNKTFSDLKQMWEETKKKREEKKDEQD